MRTILGTLCIGLLLLAIAGYLFYSNKEHQLRIPEQELQKRLEQRLPLNRTYLKVFEVTLANPRVELREETGRIGAGLDVVVALRSPGRTRDFTGTADVVGLVRYDASTGKFHLSQLEIERLHLGHLEGQALERSRAVLQKALEEYFAIQPLYTLKPGDIRQRAARMVLREVEVQGDELVLTLSL